MSDDRKKVRVEIINLYLSYTPIDDAIQQLNAAKQEAADCGLFDVDVTISDPYDSTHYLCVYAHRWETDTEYTLRLKNEAEYKERRRQEYLRLKQEFENE